MKNFRKTIWGSLVVVLGILLLAACSAGKYDTVNTTGSNQTADNSGTVKEIAFEPTTLIVYDSVLTEELFDEFVAKHIRAKYPNITLKRTGIADGTREDLSKMIAASEVPDVIIAPMFYTPDLVQLELTDDIQELINEKNTDLSLIKPALLEMERQQLGGTLAGLPFMDNIKVLVYNKSIFDDFGIPYPSDGITYDEYVELIKKVTREVNGAQYYGGSLDGIYEVVQQLGLRFLNPDTDESWITENPEFAQILNVYKQIHDVPGMSTIGNVTELFLQKQQLAMATRWVSFLSKQLAPSNVDNWDIVTNPVFDEHPDKQSSIGANAVFITKQTKYKDAAYAVMSTIAADQDFQLKMSQAGLMPVSTDENIIRAFGSDVFGEINTDAILKTNSTVPTVPQSKYENDLTVRHQFRDALTEIYNGTDVNTAMQNVKERTNQAVSTLKQK